MYPIYTAVLGSGILLRSTSCFHAAVRAVFPCSHKKITIFRGTLLLTGEPATPVLDCLVNFFLFLLEWEWGVNSSYTGYWD